MLLFLLIACQEPFEVDRHDLVGDRVAAIGLTEESGQVRPRLALFQSGRSWMDELPPLGWSIVDAGDDAATLEVDAGEVAVGVAPLLDLAQGDRLVLVIDWESGERRHFIDVPETLAEPPGDIELSQVALPPDAEIDLSVEAREQWPAAQTSFIPADGVALLRASDSEEVRWMSTGGDFLELDALATNWWPGQLVRDEDLVESVTVGTAGWVTVLAAGQGFAATEVWVGPPEEGFYSLSGRWMPTDVPVTGARVQGVLRLDDEAPSGLRLEFLEAVDDTVDPGTAGICGEAMGPFDPNWMLEGRCLRGDLDGRTVVIEVQ